MKVNPTDYLYEVADRDEEYIRAGKILYKYIDRMNDEVPEDDWRKVVSEMLEEVENAS